MNELQSPIPPLVDRTLDYRSPGTAAPVEYPDWLNQTLLQIAHRAVSLAVWIFIGRIVVACWPRKFDFAIYLLPAVLGCLMLSISTAFLSLCILRHQRTATREARGLLWVSLVLTLPTLIWMFLPQLSAVFFKVFPFLYK